MKLQVIIGSTRPGRVGLPVGQWFSEYARSHSDFDVAIADLAEINLPLYDEPLHPRLRKYQNQHTKEWSALIDAADALVIVTPEYNFAAPATVINAIDYLSTEWKYKPVGLVSYGGVSAGTRAAQMLKQVVTTVGMMPLPEAVQIPFVTQFITSEGVFQPNELITQGADLMLAELTKWAQALAPLRK